MIDPPRPGPVTRLPTPVAGAPLRRFLATEAGGAALLLAATVMALLWANSPWAASYEQLWSTEAAISVGGAEVRLDLRHWINDGAMALFFLVVGLEITRELTTGELRDRRAATVPALGAVGGMVVPAAIYLLFNSDGEAARGWGVAMSTDTAFVVGVLALFGPRCPDRLRLFLLTLAIVDDVGAIAVIALFYTEQVAVPALVTSAALVALIVGLRWARVWRTPWYAVLGVALWLAVHTSGVHGTLAGVLLGLLIPAHPPERVVVDRTAPYGRALREDPTAARSRLARLAAESAVSPNDRIQQALHPWTAYLVVPLFGLANAGVPLNSETLRAAAGSSVTLGVAVALVLGNTVGITLASAVALRTGMGVLPGRVRYTHLVGGAALAGIGFTISLFIADLAFTDDALRLRATIGIFAGSLIAAVLGSLILRTLGERSPLCSLQTDATTPTLPPRPWHDPGRLADA